MYDFYVIKKEEISRSPGIISTKGISFINESKHVNCYLVENKNLF